MKTSLLARAAWCIGHDRRLNGDLRGQWNPVMFHGRGSADAVLRITQGFWLPQTNIKISRLHTGVILPVRRWRYTR